MLKEQNIHSVAFQGIQEVNEVHNLTLWKQRVASVIIKVSEGVAVQPRTALS